MARKKAADLKIEAESIEQEAIESNDPVEVTTPVVEEIPDTLEGRIERWAKANGQWRNPMTQLLHAAVVDGSNLAFWSSVNMLDALPPAKYAGNLSREKLIAFLTTLRNVLVFVPVALTWAAISVATSAFGTFSVQNQATTVNFLAFWQNGYGYLGDFWHIDNVAELDVIIVLMVIGLTLVIARMNNANDVMFMQGQDAADEQRVVLAMELQNYFHSRREITSVTVSETVATSVAGLRGMAQEMTKAMIELKGAIAKVGETVPRVDNLGREVVAIGKASAEQITELVQVLAGGVSSTTNLMDGMGNSLTTLGKEALSAADRISDVEGSILRTNQNLQNVVSGFENSIVEVKSELDNGLAKALDRASDTISIIVNEMEVTSTSLKSSARTVQDQLETFQRSLKSRFLK